MDDDYGMLRSAARFFAWIVVDVIYELGFIFIAVWVGRLTVMVLTLGKYPTNSQAEEYEVLLGIIGILVNVSIGYVSLEYLDNWGTKYFASKKTD